MNRSALIFAALGAAVLVVLFLLLRPAQQPPAPAAAPPPAIATATAEAQPAIEVTPAQPAPMVIEWKVSKGRLQEGPVRVVLRTGDEVVLRITSDHDDELHLHGYDLSLPLRAGRPGELRFRAEHSGRFDCELHHHHLDLATLEVLPQ
ncbi:MAG TPA: hypothetical protein VLI06_04065 [Solimonas sp.]|nr:hypothetical protein [Solimonas sp.]